MKRRHRVLIFCAAAMGLLSVGTRVYGQETPAAEAEQAAINVVVNGSAIPFPGQGPVRREGQILVPLRGVFEKLGASVQFEKGTKTIVAVKGETTITLRVGDANGFVNGFPRPLAVPAEIRGGATLVPLRFISEALGAKVKWDAERRVAEVTTIGKDVAIPVAAGATPIVAATPPPPAEPPAAPKADPPKPADSKPADPKPADPKPAAKAEIADLSYDVPAPLLHGGEKISVTVVGTPGAEVTLTLPKLFDAGVRLKEQEDKPGTYSGAFSIPFNVTVKEIALTANLKTDDAAAEPKMGATMLSVDSAGPEISGIAPDDKATVKELRPKIEAKYADVGAKVDAKGTRLFLNNQEVTAQAQITESGFTYTPPADLPAGPVSVSLLTKDEYGNETRKEWEFIVRPPVKPIQKITVAPSGSTLRAGDMFTVRLTGVPGGAAKFTLGPIKDLAMKEESEGQYVGSYTAQKGDRLTKAPIVVTLVTKEGETVTQNAAETITISAAIPTAPVIDAPVEGGKVGAYVIVIGRAEPLTKVRLTLRYEGKELFKKKTEILSGAEVDVDENGRWKTDILTLDVPRSVGSVTFTVEAVTVAVTGEISPVASVRFKK